MKWTPPRLLAGIGFLHLLCSGAVQGSELPRATPESQGVSSRDLGAFIEAVDREVDVMNSFMLVRHGHVVAEGWWTPYAPEIRHQLYSLSKSFTSTAVGLAVAEGRLSVNDPVLNFFPEDAPAEPGENLRSMRVRDLLSMSTGHEQEPSAAAGTVSAKTFLAQEVPHKPGTHFRYNTAATFMLSAIVQKQTGQTVLDYLRPRLFAPLGIEGPHWRTNWQGISLGGYGLFVRTEDIARFGQLYLQKGQWDGRVILPEAWVREASSKQVANGSNPESDWAQGYGFQFWRCRYGAYRGDGAFGQYCLVLPEQDAVVAITSGVRDMQKVLNLIWDRLLPAFRYRSIPEDEVGLRDLRTKLSSLVIPTAQGESTSTLAPKVMGRTYRFPANEREWDTLTLRANGADGGATLVLESQGQKQEYPCGFGAWVQQRASFGPHENEWLAGSVAWVESGVCQIKLCAFETPYYYLLTLKFADDEVTVDTAANVGFGSTKAPSLVGRAP